MELPRKGDQRMFLEEEAAYKGSFGLKAAGAGYFYFKTYFSNPCKPRACSWWLSTLCKQVIQKCAGCVHACARVCFRDKGEMLDHLGEPQGIQSKVKCSD